MVKNSPTLTDLKKYLKNCSQSELIDEIAELFKQIPAVKDFYQIKLNPQAEIEVVEKYKKIVENEFFPARGFGKARLSVARKAVNDYKKIAVSPESVADIMLFYVEQGVQFTREYGDINESFYSSMESMYETALQWIVKHGLEGVAEPRCRRIVELTSGMGWGFYDALYDIYEKFLSSYQ